jgi:hypothetical protein
MYLRPGVTRSIESIPVGLLSFDQDINREPVAAKVKLIRDHFKPELVGVLTVSEREHDHVVLDGQHRVLGMISNPELGETHEVQCEVFKGLTFAEEARMVADLNTARTAMRPYDLYRAGLIGGNLVYQAIDKVATIAGLKVAKSASKNGVGCIKSLARVIEVHGGPFDHTGNLGPGAKILCDSLIVLIDAFGREPETYDADLIQAVALVLARNTLSDKDRERLALRMGKDGRTVMTPEQWKRRAAAVGGTGGSQSRAYAIASLLVDAYNARLSQEKRIQ